VLISLPRSVAIARMETPRMVTVKVVAKQPARQVQSTQRRWDGPAVAA